MPDQRGGGRAALLAARTDIAEGRSDDARRELEEIAARESSGRRVRALALNDLGVLAFTEGAPDRARRLFEAALAVDDNLGFSHLNLGLVLEQLGGGHEALVALRSAAWCDPTEPDLVSALRRVSAHIGRPELADVVLAEVKQEHRLVVATEADLGFMRNDFHQGRRNALRALYRRLASLARVGRVLEWDCGSGVGSQWMAEAGCRVTGVCLTTESLLYARRRHEHRGTRFVRDLDLANGQTFDLVVSRAPDASASRVLSLAAQVAPGGRLVIPDTWPTADAPPAGFGPGESIPMLPSGMPGCRQRLVVWSREAVAGQTD